MALIMMTVMLVQEIQKTFRATRCGEGGALINTSVQARLRDVLLGRAPAGSKSVYQSLLSLKKFF